MATAPAPARADQATDKARSLYETGLELYYAREHAQALIEFQRAHQVKPRPATLFMMGQCEYLLGDLRRARDHYEAYLRDSPTGEFVEVAKDRIESINRRPATLVINTVPDQVAVRITAAERGAPDIAVSPSPAAPRSPIAGEAPNNFAVPRGRWLVSVSKPNYQPQRLVIDLDVAETKPLFFKLEPIPARLEIETLPPGATLYVNGNRARNPYRQNVPPGRYEIFAEANNYEDRAQDVTLGAGDRRALLGANALRLRYVQRSGRPELLFASALMGGLIGAGAVAGTVAAAEESATPGDVATVGLTLGGALAGTIGGALLANRIVPSYIPDNRALFVIGGMWVGAAEGAMLGMTISDVRESAVADPNTAYQSLGVFRRPAPTSRKLRYAFFGSLPGLALGATTGLLMMNHAPTYGRVALIQSAAVGGAVTGGLLAMSLRWNPLGWQQILPNKTDSGAQVPGFHLEGVAEYSIVDLSLPALIGLNVGLVAGLLGAYLPDQSRYGPSWKRLALIDLAAGAGAIAGGVGACVEDDSPGGCLKAVPDPGARAKTAAAALVGGALGLGAGILLTRNVDTTDTRTPSLFSQSSMTILPSLGGVAGGGPMLNAFGVF